MAALTSLSSSSSTHSSSLPPISQPKYLLDTSALFKPFGSGCIELDNEVLNTDDPIKHIKIVDLIDETLSRNLSYTIAIIKEVAANTGGPFSHLFDANGIEEHLKFSNNQQNPVNRQPIEEISYFTLSSKIDTTFKHLITIRFPRTQQSENFICTFLEANNPASSVENLSIALYDLSTFYSRGEGIGKDKQQALEYLKRAAHLNHPKALFYLGTYYEKEIAATPSQDNLKRAFEYYQKAANLNHPRALFNLGLCYKRNKGVASSPDNPRLAFNCFEKAARLDHIKSLLYLATSYEKNIGIASSPDNLQLALRYYQRAVDLGYSQAQFKIDNLNNLQKQSSESHSTIDRNQPRKRGREKEEEKTEDTPASSSTSTSSKHKHARN